MKIVRIDGGLGNQMFCYAFALALAKASGENVLIDTHRYKFFPNHFGYELDRLFKVTLGAATMRQLWKVTYPANSEIVSRIFQRFPPRRSEIRERYEHCYPHIMEAQKDGYYIGNWQWYKYFDHIREEVLRDLSFKEVLDMRNQDLYNRLLDENHSVSLHIRRGDYLNSPQHSAICDKAYYAKAIGLAGKALDRKGHFVIFSNDTTWCIENIVPMLGDAEITVVDWNTGYDSHKDMRLMSVCRINIIANSSFSWWAAYMNSRNDKMVIAPDRWVNRTLDYRIQCDEWTCI
ncbi:MAG: alpha-1,2-fucosyltransferase [Coprobacter sp.]|nr:alpha-1,2-fucosyltransferase [Coprobacter sp.]